MLCRRMHSNQSGKGYWFVFCVYLMITIVMQTIIEISMKSDYRQLGLTRLEDDNQSIFLEFCWVQRSNQTMLHNSTGSVFIGR
jgi:hypothetical protein